jgi:hypothetical protein
MRRMRTATRGDMIYKPLVPFFWNVESARGIPITTQLNDLSTLDDLDVEASPSIY